jgi:hypothetical protein
MHKKKEKKERGPNGTVLNGTVPLSSSLLDAMQKKEEKWFFFFKPVSLSSRPPTRSPTPLDHRPKTLADHPPRAYPKNRERNLDSCTQMADQPPQPLLPMCNHKKPRPLAL